MGTFTSSSTKLPRKLSELRRLEAIYVRDEVSRENLARLGLEHRARPCTDLAFAEEYWLREPAHAYASRSREHIGLVLRPHAMLTRSTLQSLVESLRDVGSFTVYLLERSNDCALDPILQDLGCSIVSWDPSVGTFEDFLRALGGCDRIVTMRAHGAILAGLLGIPFVSVGIDPKLVWTHRIFGSSSLLLDSLEDSDVAAQAVRLLGSGDFAASVLSEAEVQRDLAKACLGRVACELGGTETK